MSFKKIPKAEWDSLSKEDQEYLNFEFKKQVEKTKRIMILTTRTIALLSVIGLFFIGYAMLENAKDYGKIKDQYGKNAFCYLCGLESLKKCECEYTTTYAGFEDYKLNENYSKELADYNSKECKLNKIIGSSENKPLPLNLSLE